MYVDFLSDLSAAAKQLMSFEISENNIRKKKFKKISKAFSFSCLFHLPSNKVSRKKLELLAVAAIASIFPLILGRNGSLSQDTFFFLRSKVVDSGFGSLTKKTFNRSFTNSFNICSLFWLTSSLIRVEAVLKSFILPLNIQFLEQQSMNFSSLIREISAEKS